MVRTSRNNRHSLLTVVFYQPNFETKSKLEWLKSFDFLAHNFSRKWNGLLLITGNFDIDVLATECTITKYYNDILNSHHLFRVIANPTRRNTSLIDHFITSIPEKIKLNDILPCCEISDQDGPLSESMQEWNNINPDSNTSVTIVSLYLKILKQFFRN